MAAGFNSGSAGLPYQLNGKFLGNVYLDTLQAYHSLPISGGAGFTAVPAAALDTAAYLSSSFAGQSGSIIQSLNYLKGAIDSGDNAAGSNTQVQFNNAGEFGASADFVFDGTDVTLGATSATTKLILRDSDIYLNSSANGQLDIVADGEVQIVTATFDLNATSDITMVGGAASSLSTTAGDLTLGGASQAGGIVIQSVEAASDSIKISASNAAGGIDFNIAGTDIVSIDANSVDIASAAQVNIASTTANSAIGDGALVVAGGASIAADLSVGDDVRLLSDLAVLSFGADSDVSLTHVADTGLTMNAAMKLMFRDSTTAISSPSANNLTMTAAAGVAISGSAGVTGDMFVGTATGGSLISVGNVSALAASQGATFVSGTELRLSGNDADGAGANFALQVSGGILIVSEV